MAMLLFLEYGDHLPNGAGKRRSKGKRRTLADKWNVQDEQVSIC